MARRSGQDQDLADQFAGEPIDQHRAHYPARRGMPATRGSMATGGPVGSVVGIVAIVIGGGVAREASGTSGLSPFPIAGPE